METGENTPKKRGPKPGPAAARRSTVLRVRVTQGEHRHVVGLAQRAQRTVSDMVREALGLAAGSSSVSRVTQ